MASRAPKIVHQSDFPLSSVLRNTTGQLDFSTELREEVRIIQKELKRSFERGKWKKVIEVLEAVAEVGEGHGQRELCLKAQALRFDLTRRAPDTTSRTEGADPSVLRLFEDLMFHLTHFQWIHGNSGP